MSDVIYKIVTEDLWLDAKGKGVFDGAGIDLADGYIHLSNAVQAQGTADKYFAGQTGLLLIAIDVDKLGDALRWESSRGGELFPHLYAPLTFDSVLWEKPLALGTDGRHLFPEI